MKLVYFARVREDIGVPSEEYDCPDHVQTVADMVSWLSGRSGAHAVAFNDISRLRFALDQNMADAESLIRDAAELAIFPPVTGG